MAFHRLTVPSYFGGLPGGYDYINNQLAGTPAFADGAKVGGPNAGTYFVAFGEDATSADFNRPHKALAENCDFIDDLLRRDLARVVRTASAPGPTSSIILTGPGVFLGNGGSTLEDLFKIVDANGENIVDTATGNHVVVTSISAGGALGGGFSAGSVTIAVSPAIPSVNYRVVYAVRSSLATAPDDVFTPSIRADADYGARIWQLAAGGIDARYRRSLSGVTGALGVAGSGGTYLRDGSSMQGYGQKNLTGSIAYNISVGSWLEALWLADNRDFGAHEPSGGEDPFPPVTPPNNDRYGGTTSGFVYLGHQRFSFKLAETSTHRAPGFASFFHGAKHYDDGVADADMFTWLPAGSAVTVSGGSVTVSGPAYFRTAGSSAIALGYDLLDLDFGDGVVRSFVINGFTSDTVATLRNLDHSIPNVPGATPATIVRWIRTRFGVFDGAKEARQGFADQQDPIYGLAGLVHITGAPAASGSNSLSSGPAQFYSGGVPPALVWGGFNPATWTYEQRGFLTALGGVTAADVTSTGSMTANLYKTQVQALSVGGIAKTVDFAAGAMARWPQPAGAGTTLTVTVSTNGVGRGWLIIERSGDAFTTLAVVSGAHTAVKIRSGDTALGSGVGTPHTIYEFQSVGTTLYVQKVGAF